MQALADRLGPYEATRVVRPSATGLWLTPSRAASDASAFPPDPVSDERVEEIRAQEARRALLSLLATLDVGPRSGFYTRPHLGKVGLARLPCAGREYPHHTS